MSDSTASKIFPFVPKTSQYTGDTIPFNLPAVVGREIYYVQDAITSGQTSGDGKYTALVSQLLRELIGVKNVLLTPSCSAALELAILALDIKEGDEVIMPSFTFVSTANAVLIRGAKPVFCEIRPDTLNLDESRVEELINGNTKAILPVHYAGIGCELNKLQQIAEKYDLHVIEDAAHALCSNYSGKPLGSFGGASTFSFHETKNFICGEGGALFLKDPEIAEKAAIMREKGTNRSAFLRGEVDKYTWVNFGSSYLLSDILAAFLFGQLESRDKIISKREEIHNRYYTSLAPLANDGHFRLPTTPNRCDSNFHIFYIRLKDLKAREELRKFLRKRNILAVFHYVPLHSAPFGQSIHDAKRKLPITTEVSDTILRLPVYYGLSAEDQNYIIKSIYEFFGYK